MSVHGFQLHGIDFLTCHDEINALGIELILGETLLHLVVSGLEENRECVPRDVFCLDPVPQKLANEAQEGTPGLDGTAEDISIKFAPGQNWCLRENANPEID